MRKIILALYMLGYLPLFTQNVVSKELPVDGNIVLTEGIEIPKVNKGYSVWLPESGTINGLIVFTHARRDTINRDTLIDYALKKQLAVFYATTENRLEFFFDDNRIQEIENYINEVVIEYKIPKDNLLYCGMSLEGTRALKLAIYGLSNKSKHKLKPKAIAICDAPLDMVRFHKSMIKAKDLNYNAIAANEGKWVSGYLEANLGGTPKDNLSAYVDYSPYSYFADTYKDLHYLKNIAFRAYTEPDVEWWIKTRRK
ncbi:MAG: hypothetical protein HKN68_04150, partial [Saprospiraceae bacterium]|nr:hypothetical protein [Saprospiraceae bacterium]